jgi:hypothetical protein
LKFYDELRALDACAWKCEEVKFEKGVGLNRRYLRTLQFLEEEDDDEVKRTRRMITMTTIRMNPPFSD